MGYTPKRTTYVLDFGADYDGLEVKVRAGSLGNLRRIQTLSAKADAATEAETEELFDRFAKLLVAWNIEDEDGTPVPATLEGLDSLESGLALTIMQIAAKTISEVPDPLSERSPAGAPSAVASLPTVPLSANPTS